MKRRTGRSPGGKQVVHEDDGFTGMDAVAVDLEFGGTVFEIVGMGDGAEG